MLISVVFGEMLWSGAGKAMDSFFGALFKDWENRTMEKEEGRQSRYCSQFCWGKSSS